MGDLVFDMIQEADLDCRADYYKHIVLSGGKKAPKPPTPLGV